MKFFRLDLLTLLISLFILNGCSKNKGTVGFNPSATIQLNGAMIDTSTIVVNTFKEDPVPTSGLSKIPLGYFNDPVFGTTESNIAASLNLPHSTAYSLPTGTIRVDSAILVMRYADGFYGDSLTSKYKVNVYQLSPGARPLNKTYYNTMNWDSLANKNMLLGTSTFAARTHDSIKIYNIIPGKLDTLVKVAPQLRIPIDKSFVNSILFNASSAMLASNTVFQNTVNGLYLTIDKSGMTGAGGTMMFTRDDSLKVYYRAQNGTTTDTTVVALPLTVPSAQIKHTFSTALNTELGDTTGSRDVIYFQGTAGTRVRIKFPYLKNIISKIGSNIAVNRAELVVTPVPGSIVPYNAQSKLTMYRYDIAHQKIELQDANQSPNQSDPRFISVSTFGGYYSPSFKSYHFIITGYVQDLMNGKTVDYGTYLAPIDTTNKTAVDINPNPQATGRTMAVGSDKNSPYQIRLNIIYTKINK